MPAPRREKPSGLDMQVVNEVLATLRPEDAQVFRMFYGINPYGAPQTLKEIMQDVGISHTTAELRLGRARYFIGEHKKGDCLTHLWMEH